MSLWYQTKDNDIYNKLQNAPPKILKTYKNNLSNVNATRTNKISDFHVNFNVSDFHVNFKKCSCGINPFL